MLAEVRTAYLLRITTIQTGFLLQKCRSSACGATAPSCRVHRPVRSQSSRDAQVFPRSPSEHCICDLHARYRTHDMLCKHVVRQTRFFRRTVAAALASSSSRSCASSFGNGTRRQFSSAVCFGGYCDKELVRAYAGTYT
jgi:hypothetical protein